MPTAEQRTYLEKRVDQIAKWSAPAASDFIRSELQSTVGGMKGDRLSDAEAAIEIERLSTVVADMPAFAITAALRDFLMGRRNDGWRPKAPDLRLAAQDHLGAIVREKRQIEAVLAALPAPALASPEKRAAAVAIARDLMVEIDKNGDRADCQRRGIPYVERSSEMAPHERLAALKHQFAAAPAVLSQAARDLYDRKSLHLPDGDAT